MKEISGDKALSNQDRLIYLAYNFIRGISGHTCWIRTKHWHPKKVEGGNDSPGVQHLNQFLFQELPKIIPMGKIDMLDVGCGSGYVRKILADAGYKGCYTGVDIYKNKDFDRNETHAFKSIFIESKIEDLETDKKFDLVLSVTSLEHIENDALAVRKCDYFLKPEASQIHILPTFWLLFSHLWHGYRQYSPQNIKSLFNQKQYKVYSLGGLFSFFLHVSFIMVPLILFKTHQPRDSSLYSKLVGISNKLDKVLPICSTLCVVVAKKGV